MVLSQLGQHAAPRVGNPFLGRYQQAKHHEREREKERERGLAKPKASSKLLDCTLMNDVQPVLYTNHPEKGMRFVFCFFGIL